MKKTFLLSFFTLYYLLLTSPTDIFSSQVSVSATVPGVNVTFSGFTAPFNIVTLFEMSQGVQIPPEWSVTTAGLVGGVGDEDLFDAAKDLGSFRADENGSFQFRFILKFFRDQNLCLRATDIMGSVSRPICFLLTTEQFDREFTRIVLPPSFGAEKISGENKIIVSGYTLRNARTLVFLDNVLLPSQNLKDVLTTDMGYFAREIVIDDYNQHAIYLKAVRDDLVTPISETKYFQILPPFYTPQRIIYETKELPVSLYRAWQSLVQFHSGFVWAHVVFTELLVIVLLVRKRHQLHYSPRILSA